METNNTQVSGGSLQISSEVIEKIAHLAAMEVEGVADVTTGSSPTQNILNKITTPRPISVEIKDGVADIAVSVAVKQGVKIPELSEKVQQNIKSSVQNMTSIIVARVDVIATGIQTENNPSE